MEAESGIHTKVSKNQNNLFKLLRETLDNSVAHAIIKLIETPILSLKAFLFVCVILSSGLCSYLIIELIMSFLSFGVSTTYRTLYETPTLFPKITFCNLNPFTTKYAMEFLRQIKKELVTILIITSYSGVREEVTN